MTTVIGIDPGPIPGIVLLEVVAGRLVTTEAAQCTAGILWDVVRAIDADLLAVERYVVGRRAGRSATSSAGQITRDQVGALQRLYPDARLRNAGQVKPWATDTRLEAAGLLELCKGMRHARDAGRHALYAAVHDGGLTDPLSKEFSR